MRKRGVLITGAAGEIGHRFNAPFSPGYRLPPLAAAAQ